MKTNKLQKTIEFIGLDYKKEISKIFFYNVLFLVAGIGIFFFTASVFYLLIFIVVIAIFDYMIVSSFNGKKQNILRKRNDEFIVIISYFEVFINNHNNVYQAFNKLINYSSPWMSEKIQTFLNHIDNDKSAKPFIDFADNFQMGAIKNVMLSIYQMIEQGEGSKQLIEFTFLFHEISKAKLDETKKKKEKGLQSMTSFPLIGASGIAIVITLSIVSIIGDVMNVI